MLASLESSHVVTVFDTFEEAGHQCVVMELCEESAAQRVARDGPFSVPEVLRVGEGALKALERAHAAGSCTGTSSPTTCCSLRTMCPRWRISAWRGCGRIRRRSPRPGRCWGAFPSCHRSSGGGSPRGRRVTCTAWRRRCCFWRRGRCPGTSTWRRHGRGRAGWGTHWCGCWAWRGGWTHRSGLGRRRRWGRRCGRWGRAGRRATARSGLRGRIGCLEGAGAATGGLGRAGQLGPWWIGAHVVASNIGMGWALGPGLARGPGEHGDVPRASAVRRRRGPVADRALPE